MFKRLLAIALIATPALASAQTVNASATVSTIANLSTAGALAFGTITPGTAATILPNAGASATATFNVTSVDVVVPTTVNLTGPGSMTANLTCNTDNSATENACGTYTITHDGDQTKLMSGTIYIGGVLPGAASATAKAGSYTGTVTVSISINTV